MSKLNAKEIKLLPHISEKSYALSSSNVYMFDVDLDVNKHEIRDAVQTQFGVTVTNVRSQVRDGKSKRSARKRSQPVSGKRTDRKLMYVTVKEGDSLPLFEELN